LLPFDPVLTDGVFHFWASSARFQPLKEATMPLTVNVGLSRKNSANYQSAGVSINLTAELDQSLLADPPRLQSEIDRIYMSGRNGARP